VGDAYTTGEEHRSAVGVQAVVAAIRTFDETEGGELLVGALAGLLVHMAGKSCTSTADKTDLLGLLRSAMEGEDIAFKHGQCHFF
jgi:hypothetical protein